MTGAPTTAPRVAPNGLVWFGLFAPPFAWAVQLVILYLAGEAGCGRPDSSLWGADLDTVAAVTIIASAALAVAGALASLLAARADGVDERGVTTFLVTAALIGAPIFLLAIAFDAVALVPLSGCRPG
jgi:hypothetical protein